MDRRGTVTLLSVTLLAVSSGWLLWKMTPAGTERAQVYSGDPDYYFGDAVFTRFDKEGRLIFDLQAKSAMHFPEDDRTELDTVEVVYNKGSGTPWRISADAGLIPAGQVTVTMQGNVNIMELDDSSAPLSLVTEYLQIDTGTNLISTDSDVQITQGDSQVTGKGLEADLDNEWFVLNSNVQATYLQ